ncbi:MAG: hypothetical protein RR326_04440 [Stenotrophomonas sp.]
MTIRLDEVNRRVTRIGASSIHQICIENTLLPLRWWQGGQRSKNRYRMHMFLLGSMLVRMAAIAKPERSEECGS